MSKTLIQVLSAAGPDPYYLAALQRATNFGDVLAPQRRFVTSAAPLAYFKCSALSTPIPPMRVGAVVRGTVGNITAAPSSGMMLAAGSPARDIPAAGQTFGAGNAQVRIVPKPGYILRYAQLNPGQPAATGAFFLASQASTVVLASVKGKVAEVWVLFANDSGAVSTSTAAQVVAAVSASAEAMQAIQSIDIGTGNGTGLALDSVLAECFRPKAGQITAAGAGNPPLYSFGSFAVSQDGELVLLHDTFTQAYFEYAAAPFYPLENEYESSAV